MRNRFFLASALALAFAAGCAETDPGAPGGGGASSTTTTTTTTTAPATTGGGGTGGLDTSFCDAPIAPGAPTGSGFTAAWARPLGDAPDGWVVGPFAVGGDAAGGTFVAGAFSGSFDLGTGTVLTASEASNGYVTALSPAGAPLWLRAAPTLATGVVAGPAVWVASTISDVTLSRFTPGGDAAPDWPMHPYGTASIAPAKGGGVWFAMSFIGPSFDYQSGTLPRGGGASQDVALLRFDAQGAVVAAQSIGATLWPEADAQRLVELGEIAAAPDGGVLVAATISDDQAEGGLKLALLRLDADGHPLWVRRLGPSALDAHPRLFSDGQGNTLVLERAGGYGPGHFACGEIPIAAQAIFYVDAAGTPRWSRSYDVWVGFSGGGFDPAGNVVLAGTQLGPIDLGGGTLAWPDGATRRAFGLKLSPSGAHLASRSFGDDVDVVCSAMTPDGALLLGGAYTGALDAGLPAATTRTAFVARFTP